MRLIPLILCFIFINSALGQISTFKGTCINSSASETDGIQTGANDGMSSTRYLALLRKINSAHMTLGPDGFAWKTQQISCDTVTIKQSKEHREVIISNGGKQILSFSGDNVATESPLMFATVVYWINGGKMEISGPNSPSCHFYSPMGGIWNGKLTTMECDMQTKDSSGHIYKAIVRFDVSQ
jgi:hypothetical protein